MFDQPVEMPIELKERFENAWLSGDKQEIKKLNAIWIISILRGWIK